MSRTYTSQQLTDYLEWDRYAWSSALAIWDQALQEKLHSGAVLRALELGGRDGGLSLYLAQKGIRTVCSGLHGVTDRARTLHQARGVSEWVEYQNIDATCINAPDHSFDIVIFKSMLGAVASHHQTQRLPLVSQEIHRVLKPEGLLLFAENMEASRLHTLARRWFTKWGSSWHYLSPQEISAFIAPFSASDLHTFGFLGAFTTPFKRLQFAAYLADRLLQDRLKERHKYIAYGWAKK